MSRKNFWDLLLCLGLCYCFGSSCTKDSPEKPLPPALGKLNELTVVMDTVWWQGSIGNQVRQRYAAAFPFVSPAQPLFNLQYLSPNRFLTNPRFLAQRNCLVVIRKYSANPQEQALAKIIESRLSQEQLKQWRDNQAFAIDKVWADPQRVMVIAVSDEKQVASLWEQYYPMMYQKIRENEVPIHESTLFRKKPDEALNRKIWEKHKIDLDLPKGTQLLSAVDSVSWLHYPYPDGGGNLWILIRHTTVAEQIQAGKAPEATLRGIMQRTPAPNALGGGGLIQIETKNPALFASTIRYQKTIPATEWRGLWSLGNGNGPFLIQLPDFPPGAPVLLAGFLDSKNSNQAEKLLELQFLLQRQRTETKP
ncbi:MAG: DUF4837 family protein [Haliscomenobacter sp.]|nr:DUF4837 family protein [Haliscomenobacter sp.]MBK9487707.1 DUF4837 family protein [Haliscomenobacter sp.]